MFYKLLEDGSVTYGLFVHSEKYLLDYRYRANYTFPVDGWVWFDTIAEAETYFNIEIK